MPVRIYDISKKLGLENKEVLAKAKELGIAARVPSSSLDKITAEFLELQLTGGRPVVAAPPPVPEAAPQSIIVVKKAPAPAEELTKADAEPATAIEVESLPASETGTDIHSKAAAVEQTKPPAEIVK